MRGTAIVRTARRLLDMFLVGLIAACFVGVVLGKLLPALGHPTLVIGGSSMAPRIPLGAAVVLESVPADRLAVGDVVSLRADGSSAIITHRIDRLVERTDGRWIETRGDANAQADPTIVPASAVVGRVAWTVPSAGYLLTMLAQPVGVLFILGLAGALLAAIWLLETIELQRAPGSKPLLRKLHTARPVEHGWSPAAGAALPASLTGDGVARRLASSDHPFAWPARLEPGGAWAHPERHRDA